MDTHMPQSSHHRRRSAVGTCITIAAVTGLAAGLLLRPRQRAPAGAGEEKLDERLTTNDRDDFAAVGELRDEQVPGVDPLPPREPM